MSELMDRLVVASVWATRAAARAALGDPHLYGVTNAGQACETAYRASLRTFLREQTDADLHIIMRQALTLDLLDEVQVENGRRLAYRSHLWRAGYGQDEINTMIALGGYPVDWEGPFEWGGGAK